MPRSFLIYLTASFLSQAKGRPKELTVPSGFTSWRVGWGRICFQASYQVDGDAPFVAICSLVWFCAGKHSTLPTMMAPSQVS